MYDYEWFPLMHYTHPPSCCVAVTSKDAPIHIWDAYRAYVRASYRAYDAQDQLEAARCVVFDPSGQKLFCGFRRMIRVFDVSRPGRVCEERPTVKSRKSKNGQKGIISCMEFNPDRSGMLAAGSFARSTCIYCERSGEMICELQGQEGGVTHVQFSSDGTCLFTGGRNDSHILCWDIRRTQSLLFRLKRSVTTNQRIGFDIDTSGHFLMTGSHCDDKSTRNKNAGCVMLYDTKRGTKLAEKRDGFSDVVNDVQFHPSEKIWCATTGQRHYDRYDDDSDDNEEDKAGDEMGAVRVERQRRRNGFTIWKYEGFEE